MFRAPVLEYDVKHVIELAQASHPVGSSGGELELVFTVYVDQTGRIVAVQSPTVFLRWIAGPTGPLAAFDSAAEMQNVFRQARVISPGYYGNTPVPMVFKVSIPVPLK
jgi:hypothetical protein